MARKKWLQISLWVLLSLNTLWAWAAVSPLGVMQEVSNHMLAQLDRNKENLKKNHVVYRIVTSTLMPYVDTERMAASVVGRQYWVDAASAQRHSFINQFTRLVISTYADALSSYNNDVVKFYPLRGNYQNAQAVTVNSIIVRKNGQRIPVNYNLERRGASWKIYDFSIENVSMIQSYRAQFAGVLARSGLSGLVARLTNHNQAIKS